MENMKAILREDGRIVIPASFRKALGLKAGDEVILILDDGEIRILSAQQAISHAQELVRNYIPEGRSLSEELIRERREESYGG